nr:NifB/NifX family molybdenum-iron cluster-binding protein [Clostridia bacterium]
AVASKSGMLVDQHFGHAEEFLIYQSDGNTARFVEKRPVPRYCEGPEDCDEKAGKMERLLSVLTDCQGVLALRIGNSPTEKLNSRSIRTFMSCDRIEDAVIRAARELG